MRFNFWCIISYHISKHFVIWNKLWFLGPASSVNRRFCSATSFVYSDQAPLPVWPSLTQRDPSFVWSFGRWCNFGGRCDPSSCCGSFLPPSQRPTPDPDPNPEAPPRLWRAPPAIDSQTSMQVWNSANLWCMKKTICEMKLKENIQACKNVQ